MSKQICCAVVDSLPANITVWGHFITGEEKKTKLRHILAQQLWGADDWDAYPGDG